jgi:riboflavin biosynthesis pyrimidine reductase
MTTSVAAPRMAPPGNTQPRQPRGTEPLSALYEAPLPPDGSIRAGLPTDLRQAYDGDLAIPLRTDRPTVIANFVETLDGAVALDRDGHSGGGAVSGFSSTDRFVMGLLRAMADVVLVGAGTLRASPGTGWTPGRAYPQAAASYRDLRARLGLSPDPTTLVVTARGDLDPTHPAFRDATVTTVIAAPAAAAERLRTAGLRDGIRIEPLGNGEAVSFAALIDLAGRLGASVILTEGGPHVLAGLAAAGLLDELFLTVAPQLVGRDRAAQRLALLEGVAFGPEQARWGQLASVRRGGDDLFLRYRFSKEIS